MSSSSPSTSPAYAEAAESTHARLALRGVSARLGKTLAVNNIDLEIAAGESVVLLGPSGCGKTTTLRMIAGFVSPDAGEIRLDGVPASRPGFVLPPEKRRLGMVFQTYAVWPHKTVAENVGYGLGLQGKSRSEIKGGIAEALDLVQLGELSERYPAELSGGQQQRVALARALATKPSLLLLDEPLSNLDASLRADMRLELRALQQRLGITSLFVTHDQEEALVLADRIVVMNKGRIEQAGTPEEVYHKPASRFVGGFIGSANILDGRIDAVDRRGGRVRVALDVGDRIWSRGPAGWLAGAEADQRVSLLLRPEDLQFERPEQPDQDVGIEVASASSAFLGSHYALTLKAGDTALQANSRHLRPFVDDRVRLWARPDSAWVVA